MTDCLGCRYATPNGAPCGRIHRLRITCAGVSLDLFCVPRTVRKLHAPASSAAMASVVAARRLTRHGDSPT
jgi:hypothetical protein